MPTSKDAPIEEKVVKLALQLAHKTILNKIFKNPELRQMFRCFFYKLTNHVIKDCHKQIAIENELVKIWKNQFNICLLQFYILMLHMTSIVILIHELMTHE
jgi:hypothetical protein